MSERNKMTKQDHDEYEAWRRERGYSADHEAYLEALTIRGTANLCLLSTGCNRMHGVCTTECRATLLEINHDASDGAR